MIDNYNGGYKKALLDVKNFLESLDSLELELKSKNQYKAFLFSFLELLLTSAEDREDFHNGLFKFKLDRKTKKVMRWEK